MSQTPVQDASAPAPGALALVQALVNTADLEDGTDDLRDADALGSWLRERGLAGPADEFAPGDVERTIAVREALRRLLLAHNGAELDPAAVRVLTAAGRAAPVVVAISDAGMPELAPAGQGIDGVIARLLAIVARAEAEGTWARLKACPAEDCHWAFYDFSRNRSRTWCTMRVCGNRAKARAYRRRSAGRG